MKTETKKPDTNKSNELLELFKAFYELQKLENEAHERIMRGGKL
jgi:hypothetical protein